MRTILITADDFGWTDGQNLAVARGAAAGTLHRASLLANGPAFSEAAAIGQAHPGLGVGVHLTLCEGRPLLPSRRLGPLCDAAGSFHDRLGPLLQLYMTGRLDVAAVRAEWQAQVERVLDAGVRPTHLDGHKHVHLLPPLFELTMELAHRYGVSYLRVPATTPDRPSVGRAPAWTVLRGLGLRARRRLRRVGGGLTAPDAFIGFADSGAMTPSRLVAAIRSAPPGVTEIMLHPAVDTPAMATLRDRYGWARRYRFGDELAALCHPDVAAALAAVSRPMPGALSASGVGVS